LQGYIAALQEYLSDGSAASLDRAFEAGRQAAEQNLSVLDIAAIHQEAVASLLARIHSEQAVAQKVSLAADFLAKALIPFEIARRGQAETAAALARKNETLERQLSERTADLGAELAERKRAEEQIRKQYNRLAALRSIDKAISASLDLRVTFNVFLEQVAEQLEVDATDILLFNPHTQTLDFGGGRGFRTAALHYTHLRLGEGLAGRAALERRMIGIPNLSAEPDGLTRAPKLFQEGFVTYYAVPLLVKGLVKGVLEIFHRTALDPDEDWLTFLEAMAGQAAIAIDSATMFEDLQRSNADLALAYDSALEGWSRALDLRDKETEGHTLRVTEMTMRLARATGIRDTELVHVRRGALLHDIGKMGIPDSILLKPGPLTDEEWVIMRKHPIYAYELLSPIAYLRPAIDIPYYHHEKWDGTGYPHGVKGEMIPLSARIFAVVDVWDALCSDRPYRKAWPAVQAREHIRSLSGTHFDPQIVDAFWKNGGLAGESS
jgi:putative nucleotidyltransferase with HDIG domain